MTVAGWGFVGLLPHVLKRVLRDGGFEARSVVRTWRDRGWLKTDNDGGRMRNQLRTYVGDTCPRVVAITRAAFEEQGQG